MLKYYTLLASRGMKSPSCLGNAGQKHGQWLVWRNVRKRRNKPTLYRQIGTDGTFVRLVAVNAPCSIGQCGLEAVIRLVFSDDCFWAIANEMVGARHKLVTDACIKAGVNKWTTLCNIIKREEIGKWQLKRSNVRTQVETSGRWPFRLRDLQETYSDAPDRFTPASWVQNGWRRRKRNDPLSVLRFSVLLAHHAHHQLDEPMTCEYFPEYFVVAEIS